MVRQSASKGEPHQASVSRPELVIVGAGLAPFLYMPPVRAPLSSRCKQVYLSGAEGDVGSQLREGMGQKKADVLTVFI